MVIYVELNFSCRSHFISMMVALFFGAGVFQRKITPAPKKSNDGPIRPMDPWSIIGELCKGLLLVTPKQKIPLIPH
jgi:hypothetical protein